MVQGERDRDGGEGDPGDDRARQHRLRPADNEEQRSEGEHAHSLAGVLQGHAERVRGSAALAAEDANHRHFGGGIDLGDGRVGEDHTSANSGGVEFEETEGDDEGPENGAEGHAAPGADAVGQRAAHDAEEQRRPGGGDQERAQPDGRLIARPGDHEEAREQEVLGDLPGEPRGIVQEQARPHRPTHHHQFFHTVVNGNAGAMQQVAAGWPTILPRAEPYHAEVERGRKTKEILHNRRKNRGNP
ncbi:MAG: hypothetical protein M5U18_12270 [Dehalococcoidia bacterium]|nr:hypothetical protein [Dehalococcoidia bacterium]